MRRTDLYRREEPADTILTDQGKRGSNKIKTN